MAAFIVRQSCEYAKVVEADSAEEALNLALGKLPEWDTTEWSGLEVFTYPGEEELVASS